MVAWGVAQRSQGWGSCVGVEGLESLGSFSSEDSQDQAKCKTEPGSSLDIFPVRTGAGNQRGVATLFVLQFQGDSQGIHTFTCAGCYVHMPIAGRKGDGPNAYALA